VFSKPSSYRSPDRIYRPHARRHACGKKLAEYYRTEGLTTPLLSYLPKGGFKVNFEPRELRAEPVVETPEVVVPIPRSFRRDILLIGALVVRSAARDISLSVLWQVQARLGHTPRGPPELQQLWEPLVSSSRPLIVCLSMPGGGVTEAGTSTGAYYLASFLDSIRTMYW
jgi:hypothetical protein